MNCKLGDLAVVVRADLACNLGNIVHVVGVCDGSGDIVFKGQGHVWIVTCARPMTWLLNEERLSGERGPVPDNRLQPVRGTATGQLKNHGIDMEAQV